MELRVIFLSSVSVMAWVARNSMRLVVVGFVMYACVC